MAVEQGFKNKFSPWCLKKIKEAAHGTFYSPEFIRSLEERIVELESAVDYERGRSNQYEAEARELREKVVHYADQFARLSARYEA